MGELLACRRHRQWHHLETLVDVMAGELYLEFFNGTWTQMRDIWSLISPGPSENQVWVGICRDERGGPS